MIEERRKTRQIMVGDVPVGGSAPVAVQSMTSTKTRDLAATIFQIEGLKRAGCEIVRVAVPGEEDAKSLAAIVEFSAMPVIADIHFDYRMALASLAAGAHALRINPGNIGGAKRVRIVVKEAKKRGVPLRVGVNAGSLEKEILEKHGSPTPEALVESALRQVELLESMEFHDFKLSIKSSDVLKTVEAYRLLSHEVDYPLHVGLTEAGGVLGGSVKSALAIGLLLKEGIGDTIRVSLTGDPVKEVTAAWAILGGLNIRRRGVDLISCPTCGRAEVDIESMVAEAEKRLVSIAAPIKVAIMGCVVNGPGEAREADIGIACGRGRGALFIRGEVVETLAEEGLLERLFEEIERLTREKVVR